MYSIHVDEGVWVDEGNADSVEVIVVGEIEGISPEDCEASSILGWSEAVGLYDVLVAVYGCIVSLIVPLSIVIICPGGDRCPIGCVLYPGGLELYGEVIGAACEEVISPDDGEGWAIGCREYERAILDLYRASPGVFRPAREVGVIEIFKEHSGARA